MSPIPRNNDLSVSEVLLQTREQDLVERTARAFLHSSLQSPVNGIVQLFEKVDAPTTKWKEGTELLPAVQFIEPPPPAAFLSAEWHAQQFGEAAGMIPLCLALHKASASYLGRVGSSLESRMYRGLGNLIGTERATRIEVSTWKFLGRKNIFELFTPGLSGLAYGALFVPNHPEEDFLSARFTNAASCALTFTTLAGSIRSLAALGVGHRPVLSGVLSGIPAGIVSAESHSLLSGKGWAQPSELAEGIYGFAIIGGGFGYAGARLENSGPSTRYDITRAPIRESVPTVAPSIQRTEIPNSTKAKSAGEKSNSSPDGNAAKRLNAEMPEVQEQKTAPPEADNISDKFIQIRVKPVGGAEITRLDEQLNMMCAAVEQGMKDGSFFYKPSPDGSFVVRVLDPKRAFIVKRIISDNGFEVVGEPRPEGPAKVSEKDTSRTDKISASHPEEELLIEENISEDRLCLVARRLRATKGPVGFTNSDGHWISKDAAGIVTRTDGGTTAKVFPNGLRVVENLISNAGIAFVEIQSPEGPIRRVYNDPHVPNQQMREISLPQASNEHYPGDYYWEATRDGYTYNHHSPGPWTATLLNGSRLSKDKVGKVTCLNDGQLVTAREVVFNDGQPGRPAGKGSEEAAGVVRRQAWSIDYKELHFDPRSASTSPALASPFTEPLTVSSYPDGTTIIENAISKNGTRFTHIIDADPSKPARCVYEDPGVPGQTVSEIANKDPDRSFRSAYYCDWEVSNKKGGFFNRHSLGPWKVTFLDGSTLAKEVGGKLTYRSVRGVEQVLPGDQTATKGKSTTKSQ